MMEKDQNLMGNEKIEQAIHELQLHPTDEYLAHTLTLFRKRMKERGHVIVAVENQIGSNALRIPIVKSSDGKQWFAVFTSYEEEMKGSNPVMSAFTAEIRDVFELALKTKEVEGVIVNPWNCTIMLDKNYINIINGVS